MAHVGDHRLHLKHGEVNRIVPEVFESDSALVEETFGDLRGELIQIM